MGQDSLRPIRIDPACFGGRKVLFVACGGGHTACILEGGSLWTWYVYARLMEVYVYTPSSKYFYSFRCAWSTARGSGLWGQLGNDQRIDRLAPGIVDAGYFNNERCVFVSAGANHTAVITTEACQDAGDVSPSWVTSRDGAGGGVLYTCGRGEDGRLGHNDTEDRLLPTAVQADWLSSAAAGPMGRDGKGHRGAIMVACGVEHTAVITSLGELYTFGCGRFGTLGHGDRRSVSSPRRVAAFAIPPPGRCEGEGGEGGGEWSESDGEGSRGDLGGSGHDGRVVVVAAGARHMAVVTVRGQLWIWVMHL